MKIATFNANSVRSRMPVLLEWLAGNAPDVLCLQETKVMDPDFPALAFREAGYEVAYRGEKSYNGVAILSRSGFQDVSFGFDDGGPADEARLAIARVGSVTVVNTYVPQGREIDHAMYAYKLKWFGRLRALFDKRFTMRQHVVWTGDLNVARDAMDIHNADQQLNHVCYHADVRKAFEETLTWGFVDVYRKHHPEPGRYTFFDYRTLNAVKRGMGWRIDYILASPALADTSRDAWIDLEPRMKEKPSDHTFLAADFDVR